MQRMRAWVEGRLRQPVVALEPLVPGMGARRYWRARLPDGSSAVLMHAAPEDPKILPPQLRRPSAELPFLTVTRLLAAHALPVPEVVAAEPAERLVLLEDVGDLHLADLPEAERPIWYERAIDLLVRVHAIPPGAGLPFDRTFDEEWIGFELAHFREHGLPRASAAAVEPLLRALAAAIAALPRTLCLRDFQSQNLMIDPRARLRILDYQDALLAPPELDLAALLHDSYVALPPELRARLLQRYAERSGRAPARDAFALVVLQRKLKDLARYRFMATDKRDPRFLPYVAAARASVQEALAALPPRLAALARALEPALGAAA
jgi:aminoglycoside/choline kinase family phosphotransferase